MIINIRTGNMYLCTGSGVKEVQSASCPDWLIDRSIDWSVCTLFNSILHSKPFHLHVDRIKSRVLMVQEYEGVSLRVCLLITDPGSVRLLCLTFWSKRSREVVWGLNPSEQTDRCGKSSREHVSGPVRPPASKMTLQCTFITAFFQPVIEYNIQYNINHRGTNVQEEYDKNAQSGLSGVFPPVWSRIIHFPLRVCTL